MGYGVVCSIPRYVSRLLGFFRLSYPIAAIDEPPQPLKLGEIRLNLRRLSKMVLGGYGGAGLIFFGVPYPGFEQPTPASGMATVNVDTTTAPASSAVIQQDAQILAQVVHEADDEEIAAGTSRLAHSRTVSRATQTSTHSRVQTEGTSRGQPSSRPDPYPNSIGRRGGGSIPFPSVSTTTLASPLRSPLESPLLSPVDPTPPTRPVPVSRPSWWEIVTGQRDQEIFEGFAAAAIAAGEIREAGKEAKKELQRGKYQSYF